MSRAMIGIVGVFVQPEWELTGESVAMAMAGRADQGKLIGRDRTFEILRLRGYKNE